MPFFEFYGLLFEWHDPKFELVHAERGITLEEAASVFGDFNATQSEDDGEYGEQRFITVGMSDKGRLLGVVWTERNETYRIITTYFANKNQERRYVNANRKY